MSFTAGPGPPSYGDALQYAPQPLPPGQPMYVFMGQAPGVAGQHMFMGQAPGVAGQPMFMGQAPGVAGQPLQPVPYMVSCF